MRRHAASLGGMCCLVFLACGDSGGGTKTTANSAKPGGTVPDAPAAPGSTDAGDPVTAQALRETCAEACRAQSACLSLTDELCMQDCDNHVQSLASDCYDEALAEQECLAELNCDEAMSYAVDGRRQHARCGEAARAYFEACTLAGGDIPEGCTALCARYQACDALEVTPAACEERCTLQATAYHASSEACSSAFLAFSACAAGAECPAVRELMNDQIAPVECEEELAALEAACG